MHPGRRLQGVSRETAGSVVTVLLSVIGEALASDETVAIAGFGTFSTRDRPARRGRNPRTGESIAIAASRTPAFKAGNAQSGEREGLNIAEAIVERRRGKRVRHCVAVRLTCPVMQTRPTQRSAAKGPR